MKENRNNDPEIQKKNNIIAKQAWHCDTYCRKVRHIDCEGKKYVKEDAPDLCPYFDEMLY